MASTGKSAPNKATVKKKASQKKPTKKKPAKKAAAQKRAAKKKPAPKKSAQKKSAPKKSAPKKSAARKKSARPRKKKAAPKAVAKSPFSKKFLAAQLELLTVERATYERQAISLKAEADSLVEGMEPGDVRFDEEGGEGDTVQVERDRDLVLSAQAQNAVGEIDHALAKFDLGTYGICEVSGDPIPEERLEAIPWARERVEYKVGGFSRR